MSKKVKIFLFGFILFVLIIFLGVRLATLMFNADDSPLTWRPWISIFDEKECALSENTDGCNKESWGDVDGVIVADSINKKFNGVSSDGEVECLVKKYGQKNYDSVQISEKLKDGHVYMCWINK